ncbi:mediator of RNA polymerase II transcription subunit 13 [Chelonus insularis]|uniref:mediator of RNA polymerase II transcription subunit 13 n=1 Tax=Chelonus insularis TaxID=460826 RepID=UPI00158DCF9D|nr:mediator of RNA polymerase II transcription subunit 13 [Chelonus insularis]
MSPEPVHPEGIEQNTEASLILRFDDLIEDNAMSENDNMESMMMGYVPLSESIADNDNSDDSNNDDDDDMNSNSDKEIDEMSGHINSTRLFSHLHPNLETSQIRTPMSNRSSIDLDTNKINQVMLIMSKFSLPTTAIPTWATVVSEDEWKNRLINRIKEIKTKQED